MHGRNDEHAAAVGRWLVARDGFDFLLYYLPEVDMAQHRVGPDAALDAVERADAAVSALVEAAGGLERFLERYAVILRRRPRPVGGARGLRAADRVRRPAPSSSRSLRSTPADSAIAVAASNRAAMIYRLTDAPPARALAGGVEELRGDRRGGFREDERSVVRRDGLELRFRRERTACATGAATAGGWRASPAPRRWSGTGGVLALRGVPERPGARRADPAVRQRRRGRVSAARGVEFIDAGGSHHLGGGSHGSLGAEDSLVPLITVGVDAVSLPDEPSITDAYGLVAHTSGSDGRPVD